MDALVYQNSAVVVIGTNAFVDVPVILQYEDTPLISVEKRIRAGLGLAVPIYHRDGTYLAKVKGSRLFLTKAGKKAGVSLKHPKGATVCKLGSQTLFELKRQKPAAVRAAAELYTPDGSFVRCTGDEVFGYKLGPDGLRLDLPTVQMHECLVVGYPVGIHVWRDGHAAIGSPGY